MVGIKRFKFHFWGPLYAGLVHTKIGLASMEALAKRFPRTLHVTGIIFAVLSILFMVVVTGDLIRTAVIALQGGQGATAQLVLPFKAKGVFYVPLGYWLLSIFIIMIIHEGAHGIWAALHRVRIKSSGAGFLGIVVPLIPIAFVELDEKKLAKKRVMQQLSILAAGPMANVVAGLLFLGMVLLVARLAVAWDPRCRSTTPGTA